MRNNSTTTWLPQVQRKLEETKVVALSDFSVIILGNILFSLCVSAHILLLFSPFSQTFLWLRLARRHVFLWGITWEAQVSRSLYAPVGFLWLWSHMDSKQCGGGMGSFQLTVVHAEGQSGQELKARICRNAMERPWKNAASWLASLSLLSLFSHIVQDHLPRGGTPHNGLGPPLSITNQEMTYRFLPASLMEAFSQWVFHFPRWLYFM